jgi:hypothetical protein
VTDAPSLFDGDPRFAPVAPQPTIDEAFRAFHAANPWVYAALVKLARQAVKDGHKRVGMKMLWEVLRWEWTRQSVTTDGEWRMNNSFTSRYARLIAANEADLVDVFETRALRAA